uniref:ARAD1D27830p n=1 Tax=Blastobotrys adeninivorans TaxID=409370 RepID=A0A060TAL2_BLAAD
MEHADMPDKYKKVVPHANGGTKTRSSLKAFSERSSDEGNLTYDDVSFYYNYYGDSDSLAEWLRKVVPVAAFASIRHDTFIDIGEGVQIADEIEKVLEELDFRGRRCIGLFGHYSIVMPSRPHFIGTQFITWLNELIGSVLEPQNLIQSIILRRGLVTETGNSRRVLQDETARPLVHIVRAYCRDRLHVNFGIPNRVILDRSSTVYQKEPDQSFQPGYQELADNGTDLPTVICEVGMSDTVSKVIFDCLTSLAGSRGKIDLSLGVDLAINNIGLTGIRLFVFDSSITTLVRFAERNQSVARFTRSKIENRLIHLRYLRDRLQAMQTREERVKYEAYVHIQPTVLPTIEYYERTRDYLMTVSEGEVTGQDIVETCRVVLENAEVVQMTEGDDDFIVTDINGEPLNGLAVKVEAFLGLLLGYEAQVTLDIETLESIFLAVAEASQSKNLEGIPSPIPLVVTRRHISDGRYDEFVASQGTNFNREAFKRDQPVTAPNVSLGHLRDDTVIRPAAKAYLDRENFRSRALKMASALFWFREKQRDGVEVYDLVDLDSRQARERQRMWSND